SSGPGWRDCLTSTSPRNVGRAVTRPGLSVKMLIDVKERDTLSVWQVVELARHPDRPYALDYIRRLAPDFLELHGDRMTGDDPALVAGVGRWRGRTVMLMGHQKGRNLADRVARNWGMMHPEGYRKAMRLARQAAKFG